MCEPATLALCAGRLVCGLAGENIEFGFGWLKGIVRTFIEVLGVHRERVVALLAEWIVDLGHNHSSTSTRPFRACYSDDLSRGSREYAEVC